ncbi:MAG: PepSY-associated TM helix domain-containing protein [Brevundimonas sp.]
MTQTTTETTTRTPNRPATPKARKRSTRRPVRRFMVVTHRWASLVLGLVLLVICTSGAILLYRPELAHAMNGAAYSPSGGPDTVSLAQAFATVDAAKPEFDPTGVVAESGILKVHDADYSSFWTVDPSTGEILGHIGATPAWIAFLDNLHECFLSCEGEAGYIGVLDDDVPYSSWLGFDGAPVTWGGLVLGTMAVVLLFISLTGLWLWFPRPNQWKKSMNIRWNRGRFARDTDLHKVAGLIAIPFLLLWGVTGGGFEFQQFEKAWYAMTPGHQLPEVDDPVSVESAAPDIGIDAAVVAAQEASPGDKVVSVDVPAADDPTGVYYIWLGTGFDPYGRMEYPGNRGVVVERHTGEATVVYGSAGESTAQTLWDAWSYPVHSGYIVNGWWRLIWLTLGLSPLLLGITGVSTWLVRRSSKTARRRATKQATRAPEVSPRSVPS